MKMALSTLSYLALVGIILPPILYLTGMMEKGPMMTAMLVATIVWFAATPFWMKGGEEGSDSEVE